MSTSDLYNHLHDEDDEDDETWNPYAESYSDTEDFATFLGSAYGAHERPSAQRNGRQAEYVDLTSDPAPPVTRQSQRSTRRPSDHGVASRGPRFPNDIIDVDVENTRGLWNGGRANRIENDGFEIVGQRQVSPRPQRTAAMESLSNAHRNAVGSIMATFARNLPLPMLAGFLPPSLDYRQVPFYNVGMPDLSVPDPEPAPAPRYSPPPAAPPGFTHTPSEDDVYVCPNCDEELRTGENDVERQVWVIKACGHAYCGQCATNRFTTKQKKLKSPSKTKPFKQCVVEDCLVRTTGVKSMTQIFI